MNFNPVNTTLFSPTTGGVAVPTTLSNQSNSSSTNDLGFNTVPQTVNQSINTSFGNFTSSLSIPQNAVVPPPVGTCNSTLQNVSQAIPSMLQNTIQPASQIVKGIESAL